jgi:hypothetical protein
MIGQQTLFEVRRPDCPFAHLIDHDDTHCDVHMFEDEGYEVIGDNSATLDDWMAEARGVQLDDVIARDIVVPPLPNFIPNVPRGNTFMYKDFAPAYVTVNLGKLVSMEKLSVSKSLTDLLGLPPTAKVIIQCYGKDRLIENIWPVRHEVFRKLAQLQPYAITSVNYSVWDSQPHGEQLLNIKRGLLTFEDLQELDLPTIPHIYWSSKQTIHAWAKWLHYNDAVNVVAINLQTLRKASEWTKAMDDLRYFKNILPRNIHFLITGPQAADRVREVVSILGNVTLSNGYAAYAAASHYELQVDGGKVRSTYTDKSYGEILQNSIEIYNNLIT